jgi:hypothetical protein
MATSKNWPTLDVWVMVYHSHEDLRHPPCMVIVHIPKNSLDADENNCPAHDTKLVGEGFSGNGVSTGYHVIILKKGALNDPKSYSLMPPKRKPKLVPDYIHIWTANGNLFTSMDKA